MRKRSQKYYLGVDPGICGGLCVVREDGTPMEWSRMPDSKVQIIDHIIRINTNYTRLILVTELAQAMPKQGVTSCFRYGQHFGTFEDTAILLKLPYHEVRPAVWKKALSLTSNKMDSIKACRRIFPSVGLIPSGCRKEHDGIAEALLIAEWARRKSL